MNERSGDVEKMDKHALLENLRLGLLQIVGLNNYNEAFKKVFPDYPSMKGETSEDDGEYEKVDCNLAPDNRIELLKMYGPKDYPKVIRAFFSDLLQGNDAKNGEI